MGARVSASQLPTLRQTVWGWIEGILDVAKAFRRLDANGGSYLKEIQVSRPPLRRVTAGRTHHGRGLLSEQHGWFEYLACSVDSEVDAENPVINRHGHTVEFHRPGTDGTTMQCAACHYCHH